MTSADYWWISCQGCDGEVGVPSDWDEDVLNCPSCGANVQVKGRVLYRPKAVGVTREIQLAQPAAVPALSKLTNLELARASEAALVCGILSIVLGWTFITPIIGVCKYCEALHMAKEDAVPTPAKATVGLVLSLLFGIVQGLAVIHRLS
jgi:hypothetical protein